MRIDRTKDVEKSTGAIPISSLDTCSFYKPEEGSLVIVKLCTYCKYGQFDEKNRNGFCVYHGDTNGRSSDEK